MQGGVIIITGASSGIGKATALELSKRRYPLALIGRDTKRLEEVGNACEVNGSSVRTYACDLGNIEVYAPVIGEILSNFGAIRTLVNNAGLWDEKLLTEYTPHAIDQMITVNFSAVVHLSRLCAPHIRTTPLGAIITIGSVAGLRSYARGSIYGATKNAVRAFSKTLFLEERVYGSKVCIINPGVVDTAMHDGDVRYTKKEMLTAEDVAHTIKFVVEFSGSGCPTEITLQPQYGKGS